MPKHCIMILGMHRSGTSALAGGLSMAGGCAPIDMIAASESNERGHWESSKIVRLNDAILSEFGSAWDDWLPLDFKSLPAERIAHFHDEICKLIQSEFLSPDLIVLKDPRLCRMIEVYLAALRTLDYEIVPLIIYRDPRDVSASLERRDGIDKVRSELIWLRHNLDAEYFTRGMSRMLVAYPNFIAGWHELLKRIDHLLGSGLACRADRLADLGEFLDLKLQHHSAALDGSEAAGYVWPWTLRCFGALEALRDGQNNATAELDSIRLNFDSTSRALAELFASRKAEEKVLQ